MSGPVRPLVVHVVYRFGVGGLENGVVNLLNHMPAARWRHAIVSLTDVDPAFARRVRRDDVEFVELHKPPGHAVRLYPALWRLFRRLRPDVVHSRNLAALETQAPAWAAGVPARVHGEHGRDADDVDGTNRRNILTRRLYKPFVHRYIALGRELAGYLDQRIHVPAARVATVYNGVDVTRFMPAPQRTVPEGCPFTDPSLWLAGTVGRMMTVKAQPVLARAFVQALDRAPELRARLRLVMVGDGPLRAECEALLAAAGVRDLAWLPGERADVPEIMRGLDCFVLPSLVEGISNTILEAMASGLPVLATQVGANAELVEPGLTGHLVAPNDVDGLAGALVEMARSPAACRQQGAAGRESVVRRFSLDAMVRGYESVYESALRRSAPEGP